MLMYSCNTGETTGFWWSEVTRGTDYIISYDGYACLHTCSKTSSPLYDICIYNSQLSLHMSNIK